MEQIFIIIGVLLLGYLFITNLGKQKKIVRGKFETTLIEVIMPRTNENGPKVFEEFLEKLQIFEGKDFYKKHILKFHIWKRKETFRFIIEIAKEDYHYVVNQLYSYFPDSEIFVGDKSPFFINSKFVESENLVLENNDIYPLKTFEDFEEEVNPINSVLSSLHKSTDEEVLYTVEIEPLGNNWHTFAKNLAKIFLNKKSKLSYSQRLSLKDLYENITGFERALLFIINSWIWFAKKISSNKTTETIDLTEGVIEVTKENKKEETLDREVKGQEKSMFLNKILSNGYRVNISLKIGTEENKGDSYYKGRLSEITQSFSSFGRPYINKLKLDKNRFIYLTNKEISMLYYFPISSMKNQPGINWRNNVTLTPPEDLPLTKDSQDVAMIGTTRYREVKKEFGLLPEDRRRHMYIIGKTGMGKSTLLENMIYDDIKAGRGVAIIDPHGDTSEAVISFIPQNRINDVIIFDPSDLENPIGFNLLESVNPEMNTVIANGIVQIFKKMNANSWGPRLEHILYNTLLTLLQVPNTSLLAVSRILVDREYRKYVVEQIDDPVLKSFWEDEIGKMQEKMLSEALAPIQNKIGPFISSPMIRNIVGQAKNQLSLRYIMDNQKIFICNLSKGKLGELNSAMLGSMIITKFQIDAMGRATIPQNERKDFYLYVDEFQNFATDSFAVILSEARKYRLNLIVANQYINQMPDEVKNAVFGNIGTILNFQIGFDDAQYIANQYEAMVTPQDLMGLGVGQAYTRLLIRNLPTKVFSITTSTPRKAIYQGDSLKEHIEKVKRISRERYTSKRADVEEKIKKWQEPKLAKSTLEKAEKEKMKKEEKQKEKSSNPSPINHQNNNHQNHSNQQGNWKKKKKFHTPNR